jgi:hypothetical protein
MHLMDAASGINRLYVGDTDRYVCDGCDAWVPMQRMADSRGWEPVEGSDGQIGHATIDPASLSLPLQPTLYCCSRCGHEHDGLPSLKNPI